MYIHCIYMIISNYAVYIHVNILYSTSRSLVVILHRRWLQFAAGCPRAPSAVLGMTLDTENINKSERKRQCFIIPAGKHLVNRISACVLMTKVCCTQFMSFV